MLDQREGAARISWSTSGDFKRCVAELGNYISDLVGLCNTYRVETAGGPPGHGSADCIVRAGKAAWMLLPESQETRFVPTFA
ncbi:Uncharacterised protein [Mycolicibacterium phlei]|nr:Uncharacterised protein [Mycolicibacterium phlei]